MKRSRVIPSPLSDRLQAVLQTDEGMRAFLDKLAGANNWSYDSEEDVWVTSDPNHVGPGRGFVVIQRGGSWYKAVLPDTEATH